MVSTLDMCRNIAFKDSGTAVSYLFHSGELKKTSIILYSSNSKELSREIEKFYSAIQRYNSEVDNPNEQILPTNPYFWDDIDGCLYVRCAEIGVDTVSNNAGTIALFTGYNTRVIAKEFDRVPVNNKAMASLALLGRLAGEFR